MHEQSEGNNHTSKINIYSVSHTIFFLLGGHEMDLFALHGTIKATLWSSRRKNIIYVPPARELVFFATVKSSAMLCIALQRNVM